MSPPSTGENPHLGLQSGLIYVCYIHHSPWCVSKQAILSINSQVRGAGPTLTTLDARTESRRSITLRCGQEAISITRLAIASASSTISLAPCLQLCPKVLLDQRQSMLSMSYLCKLTVIVMLNVNAPLCPQKEASLAKDRKAWCVEARIGSKDANAIATWFNTDQ